jgi:ferredoxin
LVEIFYTILYKMTTKQRKHFATMLGICSVLTMLWWCQNKTETIDATGIEPSVLEVTEPADTPVIEEASTQDTTSIAQTTAPQEQKLSINNRCIGCGHCAKMAGDSFSIEWRVAEVISQENIDSPSVAQAIARCPVQAIEIIEV